MSFDDILDDVFEFEEDTNLPPENVTKEEADSGLWDTGTKENIWRSSDPQANGVWDSGCSGGCDTCGDDCEDDLDGELYDDPEEMIDPPEDIDAPDPAPVDEETPADSGLFDDLF